MIDVYLAGPIRETDDSGRGWRATVGDRFDQHGIEWHNPLDAYDVPEDDVTIVAGHVDTGHRLGVATLVERDKSLIDECDAVLVGYSEIQQIGTPMEVLYAYERDIPVVIWHRDGFAPDHLSPWYRYHAEAITSDIYAAVRAIKRHCGGGA